MASICPAANGRGFRRAVNMYLKDIYEPMHVN
jgi:hypothetical protein